MPITRTTCPMAPVCCATRLLVISSMGVHWSASHASWWDAAIAHPWQLACSAMPQQTTFSTRPQISARPAACPTASPASRSPNAWSAMRPANTSSTRPPVCASHALWRAASVVPHSLRVPNAIPTAAMGSTTQAPI